jgi:hypothetical protein
MAPLSIPSPDGGQGISFFLLAAPPLLSSQTRQPHRSRTSWRIRTRQAQQSIIAPECSHAVIKFLSQGSPY